jgi:hypothetical protein
MIYRFAELTSPFKIGSILRKQIMAAERMADVEKLFISDPSGCTRQVRVLRSYIGYELSKRNTRH